MRAARSGHLDGRRRRSLLRCGERRHPGVGLLIRLGDERVHFRARVYVQLVFLLFVAAAHFGAHALDRADVLFALRSPPPHTVGIVVVVVVTVAVVKTPSSPAVGEQNDAKQKRRAPVASNEKCARARPRRPRLRPRVAPPHSQHAGETVPRQSPRARNEPRGARCAQRTPQRAGIASKIAHNEKTRPRATRARRGTSAAADSNLFFEVVQRATVELEVSLLAAQQTAFELQVTFHSWLAHGARTNHHKPKNGHMTRFVHNLAQATKIENIDEYTQKKKNKENEHFFFESARTHGRLIIIIIIEKERDFLTKDA